MLLARQHIFRWVTLNHSHHFTRLLLTDSINFI